MDYLNFGMNIHSSQMMSPSDPLSHPSATMTFSFCGFQGKFFTAIG